MDKLKSIFSLFDNPEFNWLPHVVFAIFLVIALLIGFWIGRRSAIFFGGAVVLAFVATIVVTTIGLSFSLDLLIPKSWEIGNTNLRDLIANNPQYLLAFMALPVFIASLVAILIVSLIPYFIFRKKYFKKNMKILKSENKSTIAIRSQGALISIVFMVPVAAFFASYGASLANDQSHALIYSKMTNIFTVGRIDRATMDVRETMRDS